MCSRVTVAPNCMQRSSFKNPTQGIAFFSILWYCFSHVFTFKNMRRKGIKIYTFFFYIIFGILPSIGQCNDRNWRHHIFWNTVCRSEMQGRGMIFFLFFLKKKVFKSRTVKLSAMFLERCKTQSQHVCQAHLHRKIMESSAMNTKKRVLRERPLIQ